MLLSNYKIWRCSFDDESLIILTHQVDDMILTALDVKCRRFTLVSLSFPLCFSCFSEESSKSFLFPCVKNDEEVYVSVKLFCREEQWTSSIPVFDDVVSNTIASISTTVFFGTCFPSLNVLMILKIPLISSSWVSGL